MDRNQLPQRPQLRGKTVSVGGAQLAPAAGSPAQAPMPMPTITAAAGRRSKVWWVGLPLAGLAGLAVLVLGITWAVSYNGETMLVKRDKYQAVFLANGQVYFGKIKTITRQYVQLTDIYYLQVQQQDQKEALNNAAVQPQIYKLGSELHGPEDSMQISRDQFLFWENMKDDSKVVKAIGQQKK